MTKLEGVESGSRRSRRRCLRGTSLRLGLLGRLGLVSRALLVSAMPSTVSSAATTPSLTVTLLLFKGWLIRSALDSAQLLSLVSRGLASLSLLPCENNGLAHVGYVQGLDVFLLTEELGESIEGAWELGHDQHGLEVVWYLKPRRIASGEVGCHLIDGDGGIFAIGDLDIHG